MGYQIAAGHRLRLALSNSYWPFVWPSPQAGRLTVTAGLLDLPIHAAGLNRTPPPPDGAKPLPQSVTRPAAQSRLIFTDPRNGNVTLQIVDDQGDTLQSHGLIPNPVRADS